MLLVPLKVDFLLDSSFNFLGVYTLFARNCRYVFLNLFFCKFKLRNKRISCGSSGSSSDRISRRRSRRQCGYIYIYI